MEQVFSMVNRILKQSPKTSHLCLRTYRVIPLQPLAGLLEWVSNAIPIGDYLSEAHARINVNDLPPKEARLMMKHEFEDPATTPARKIALYTHKLCPRFAPIFRHFFLEYSSTCQEWYDKRRLYIHSAAVSSMVGYIVGLGDRHCQNIMIDHQSGELIQIDLNMILELGKSLRIPERVPFRLTRDIVDAMGPFGLQAPFMANSVRAMSVLRVRSPLVLMIMEAFKYDPLYRWSTRPPRTVEWHNTIVSQHNTCTKTIISDEDEEDEGEGHKEAERALLRVKEKLMGIEEGTVLSEQGQVNYLVNMAMNPDILAQMYPGWQPWM